MWIPGPGAFFGVACSMAARVSLDPALILPWTSRAL